MSAVLSVFDQPGYSPDRQIAQLRIPPHSIEGESSVLGGLLLDTRPIPLELPSAPEQRRAQLEAWEAPVWAGSEP